jgi:hypothetical protein
MSYYVLGVLVAYVHFLPRQKGYNRALVVLCVAMLWPITVPLAPCFWLYCALTRPRPETTLQELLDYYGPVLEKLSQQGKV